MTRPLSSFPASLAHRRELVRRLGLGQAALAVALAACAIGPPADPPPGPRRVAAESLAVDQDLTPAVDVDSLARLAVARAETTPAESLPALEAEIRDWLGRLEYEDPTLLPPGREPGPYFRAARGRLLDALGWVAFRRGDLRQAEAALVSAEAEINSRGTRDGYALHFLHLGELHLARGRLDRAIDAFLAAEARGAAGRATPRLEAAWRRRHGSFRGLDSRRARLDARIEDERRQAVVADIRLERLPSFSLPRRTGPPLASGELMGRPTVLALWGPDCAPCDGYAERLADLSRVLLPRDATVVGVWLGEDPGDAGPPQPFQVVSAPDPATRRLFGVRRLPTLLVVDAAGLIRYRHDGAEAIPLPIDDIVLQIDHLERRRGRADAGRVPDGEDA